MINKLNSSTLDLNNFSDDAPISVLMCVFNDSGYLKNAIKSVLNQTWKNFEFIIIDDGSYDNTPDTLSKFSENEDRIKVFRKKNTGLTASLNYGINLCSSPLIARIDADDLWHSNKLEKQMNLMNKFKYISLIGTSANLIDEKDKVYARKTYPSIHKKLRKNLLKKKGHFPHSSVIFRKEVVQSLGGYDENFKRAQDYELWLRVSFKHKISCINEPLVLIRKHQAQISSGTSEKKQFYDSRKALIKHELSFYNPKSYQSPDIRFEKVFKDAKPLINKIFVLRRNINKIKKAFRELKFNSVAKYSALCLLSPKLLFTYILFGENYKKFYK